MSHALVTGASGFIGQHLARALVERGDCVTCLVRSASRGELLKPLGVELAMGDVTDAASVRAELRSVDVVYHLAGLTKALRASELFRVNQLGTRNVVEAATAQANPPTVVVVSSLAAAGPAVDGRPRVETDPASPVSHYGRSKLAGEQAAAEVAANVPVTIVRPPIVLGEGDRASLEMYKPIVRFGLHLVPGFTPHQYSVIHADDLASALILAAERGQRVRGDSDDGFTGRYFAAADEMPTYAEIGQMVAEAFSAKRFRAHRIPLFLAAAIANTSQLGSYITRRPVVFGRDKLREASAGSWICSPRALRELGFQPAKPFAERLKQTADWYRQQGWV
jgi:nucleoside-diphosphate-sugar epimerase